jgi:hypothetical protein
MQAIATKFLIHLSVLISRLQISVNFALGIGHWALGIGHWALGIGHWAFPLSSQDPQIVCL